jgi:hypothetical protein
MASISSLSDIFKYIAYKFGGSNKWLNGNASQRRAINITYTAPADVSMANASVNNNKKSTAAGGKSDSAVVSSIAETASTLHGQIKSTGSENAAIFRMAVASLVSSFSSNPASGALGSFLGFGAAMAETGNLKTYTDMSLMVTGLSRLTSANSSNSSNLALASKFMSRAQSSFQSFGVETAGGFINSARKIMSVGASDGANKGSQVSALNNLSKLWETTSNLKGFSVEQKTGMLANIAANVESKGSLSKLNDYLKQQLEAMDGAAEEKTLTKEEPALSSEAIFNNLVAGAYSKSTFVDTSAAEGFQSALPSVALKSGADTADMVKSINAYRSNMNLSKASTLLNTGV